MASKEDTGKSSDQAEGSSISSRGGGESVQTPGAARPSQIEGIFDTLLNFRPIELSLTPQSGPPGPSSEEQGEDSIPATRTQAEEDSGARIPD
jgi:hypothetical protein